MSTESRPEFSNIVSVEDLATGQVRRQLRAEDAERAALTGRFGILSVEALSATVALRRLPASSLVRIEGRLTAAVTQSCIRTLAPVADHIDVSFSEIFSPADYQPRDEIEEDEIVDSFDDDGIDIGEIVAQHLALSLEAYPRAEGVDLPDQPPGPPDSQEDEKQRPLAGLGEILRKRH